MREVRWVRENILLRARLSFSGGIRNSHGKEGAGMGGGAAVRGQPAGSRGQWPSRPVNKQKAFPDLSRGAEGSRGAEQGEALAGGSADSQPVAGTGPASSQG